MNPDKHILETWHQNAEPWVRTIASEGIESRLLVTNDAIVSAIAMLRPANVWDAGCGEGWLCRALNKKGIPCMGTDAIGALVEAANRQGGGIFEVLAYDEITSERVEASGADTIVFNFSLFGNEAVHDLFSVLRQGMPINGSLVIQTLHPFASCGKLPYKSGWREGSWDGFSPDFVNPAPWYYRTIGDWIYLLHQTGYTLKALQEPVHPHTGLPASLIMIASPEKI